MNKIALPRLANPLATFRQTATFWRWRHMLQRYGRAWRYARETWHADDAEQMAYDTQEVAGVYPLESLKVSSLLDCASDRWGDHPELERLAAEAADRVGDKWESDGHLRGAAEDWAMNLIEEYAARDGIELREID